jgi:hypothetical protein
VLDVGGQPMIHVTRNRLPEIVLFGPQQELLTPLAINAGNDIMITSQGGNQIAVSKFSANDGDQKRTVSTRVDEVIRAVVELGGTYPDVVQALQEAKDSGALVSRFEVDALPEAGRAYDRVVEDETTDGKKDEGKDAKDSDERVVKATPHSPAPDLFYQKTSGVAPTEGDSDDSSDDADSKQKPKPKKGFFGNMFGS